VIFVTQSPLVAGFLYYDGKEVGSAGEISQLMATSSTSPIYFFTTDETKDNTIFSIYEIR
jgi:hypothetical protein